MAFGKRKLSSISELMLSAVSPKKIESISRTEIEILPQAKSVRNRAVVSRARVRNIMGCRVVSG